MWWDGTPKDWGSSGEGVRVTPQPSHLLSLHFEGKEEPQLWRETLPEGEVLLGKCISMNGLMGIMDGNDRM